ncbi:MAG TPA: S41 family peptidase, partial [Candidatus Acidoferrales bacterium]|nr:S41 family peptidase [Candidatus Acidoferrales bacterium]
MMRVTRRELLATASALAALPLLGAAPTAEPTFPPEAVRSDLDAIWQALIDVGVQPFRSSDRTTVEQLYRSARTSMTAPMGTREAWLGIAPVLGALNDGHVGLLFPQPLNAAPRLFPLRFALAAGDDALIVVGDRTKTVPIGSKLVSVEGVPADRFRVTTLAAFGGQTPALHRERVSMAGAWTAIALFGDRPAYDVRWMGANGSVAQATIPKTLPTRGVKADPYTYSTLRGGTVGYLDYRSCEDLDRFKAFLQQTFEAIRQQPVRALVIDIRRNGGGDSDLNDQLWQYAQSKPFKQFGASIEKACDRLKREYGEKKYVDIYGEQAWNAPNGTVITYGGDPNQGLIVPGPLPIRYRGPVYLLISTGTFSSAMSCAVAAKDYDLATIVGEETGEPVNSTGEIYFQTAP